MTTLAIDDAKDYEIGIHNDIPVIAADIIYEGAAVGVVTASGHARPLQPLDRFAGFAQRKADNSAGAAAAINVRTVRKGVIKLSVSGAVITDINQPVYATDDNTFVFNPAGGVFIGFVKRWVSAGVVMVEFDAGVFTCPYAALGSMDEAETLSGNKTFDVQDNGKVFFVDTDGLTLTLPAEATGISLAIVNIGALGTVALNISPAAIDMIHAPDIAGTDDKDHINTKATAQRGDFCKLVSGLVATGYTVVNQRGIWAQEAP